MITIHNENYPIKLDKIEEFLKGSYNINCSLKESKIYIAAGFAHVNIKDGDKNYHLAFNEVDFYLVPYEGLGFSISKEDFDKNDKSEDYVKYLLENDKDFLDNEIEIFFGRNFRLGVDKSKIIDSAEVESTQELVEFTDAVNTHYEAAQERNDKLYNIVLDYQLNHQSGSQK